MKELFAKYYHLFDWECGDNTCLTFTVVISVILILGTIEVIYRIKNKKSLFF